MSNNDDSNKKRSTLDALRCAKENFTTEQWEKFDENFTNIVSGSVRKRTLNDYLDTEERIFVGDNK